MRELIDECNDNVTRIQVVAFMALQDDIENRIVSLFHDKIQCLANVRQLTLKNGDLVLEI